jgi:hypothetical protein
VVAVFDLGVDRILQLDRGSEENPKYGVIREADRNERSLAESMPLSTC